MHMRDTQTAVNMSGTGVSNLLQPHSCFIPASYIEMGANNSCEVCDKVKWD